MEKLTFFVLSFRKGGCHLRDDRKEKRRKIVYLHRAERRGVRMGSGGPTQGGGKWTGSRRNRSDRLSNEESYEHRRCSLKDGAEKEKARRSRVCWIFDRKRKRDFREEVWKTPAPETWMFSKK